MKWNQMSIDEIKKQIKLEKWLKTKQILIKGIDIKHDKWKKLNDGEIKKIIIQFYK